MSYYNKYGVPYHQYDIELADGRHILIDIGNEEDWGNIQAMNYLDTELFAEGAGNIPVDWANRVGWGNDEDGHTEIIRVIDIATNKDIPVHIWAMSVWEYGDKYSA